MHLLPVLFDELQNFGVSDIRDRLLRGGPPQGLLDQARDLGFYAEWMDSYYARDVQELFKVEKRTGFIRLLRLLLRQSGGLVEFSKLARDTGLSRATVMTYLDVFEATHTAIRLLPHSGKRRGELACIIHEASAAAADLLASSGLPHSSRLDSPPRMPSPSSIPGGLTRRHLDHLATNPRE